ncbi:hypothetical protein Fcan01_05926 [Folsomia candida]|uniref:Uncharacterized protein n=1 Tax=Folsomia candida TaxID=158441 RepID=A0A226EQS2_FOLCA|nr:hypothetical protein Fcan01_05926 [Folsomia candida]
MAGKRKAVVLVKTPINKRITKPRKVSAPKKLKLCTIPDQAFDMGLNIDPNSSENSDNSPITIGILTQLLNDNTKILTSRFDNLDTSVALRKEKLDELESEVKSLKIKVSEITGENERLWCELSKINLIFSGIPERINESQKDLFDQVANVIKATGHTNEVYGNRFKVNKPTFINEDLPASLRNDHRILRQKRSQLRNLGYDAKQIHVDWSTRTINSGESSFYLLNGNLIEKHYKTSTTPTLHREKQRTSNLSFGNTRSSTQPRGSQAPGVGAQDPTIMIYDSSLDSLRSQSHPGGYLQNLRPETGSSKTLSTMNTNNFSPINESPLDDSQNFQTPTNNSRHFLDPTM